MSKYKVLSSLLRLVTVDRYVFKATIGYSQTLAVIGPRTILDYLTEHSTNKDFLKSFDRYYNF
jgi:hypothetical protein